MDPKNPAGMWLAPGSTAGAAKAYAPGKDDELPAVDDNIVEPDSGYELVDGVRVELAPAKEAHGEQHFDLPGVFKMCLAPGYKGAVDMLTRTDKKTNIAPDVSIYPDGRDPVTGGRKLEELVFEVLDSQALNEIQWRAQRLIARGVRRAFAIHATEKTLSEWMPEQQEWRVWQPHEFLADRCFVVPVAVSALLDATLADDTVVRALIARNSPPLLAARLQWEAVARDEGIEKGIQEGIEQGRAQELRTLIVDLCEAFGIEVTDARRSQLAALPLVSLEALRTAIKHKRAWPEQQESR